MIQLCLYTYLQRAEWPIWLLQLKMHDLSLSSFLKNLSLLQMSLLYPNSYTNIKILVSLWIYKLIAISKLSSYRFSCYSPVTSQIYISLKLIACRQLCGGIYSTMILQEVIWQEIPSEKPEIHSCLISDMGLWGQKINSDGSQSVGNWAVHWLPRYPQVLDGYIYQCRYQSVVSGGCRVASIQKKGQEPTVMDWT